MSQFDTTMPQEEEVRVDPGQGNMSGLAIASLVCSLILCCPLVTLVGALLGIAGLFHTKGGRRRGRGLAITGLILGIVFTVGGVVVGFWAFKTVLQVVVRGPALVMEAGYAGDTAGVKQYFDVGHVPTDEEIDAFFATAKTRFGEFKSATLQDNSNQTQSGNQDFKLPFDVVYAKARLLANVQFRANENVKTGSGSMIGIVKITIVDPEAGDLVLEASPVEEENKEESPATKEPDVP